MLKSNYNFFDPSSFCNGKFFYIIEGKNLNVYINTCPSVHQSVCLSVCAIKVSASRYQLPCRCYLSKLVFLLPSGCRSRLVTDLSSPSWFLILECFSVTCYTTSAGGKFQLANSKLLQRRFEVHCAARPSYHLS